MSIRLGISPSRLLLLCFFELSLTSCTGPRVAIDYDYDKSVPFGALRTFAWLPQPPTQYADSRYANPIIDANIKTFLSEEFERLGMQLDTLRPDILLSYDLFVEKGERTEEEPVFSQPPPPMMMPPPGVMGGPGLVVGPGGMAVGGMFQPHPMNFNFWNQPVMPGAWMPAPQIIGYRTRQIPFKNGTLVVSAQKRADHRLIWRGWAESCIMDPGAYKSVLETKAAELVATYPLAKMQRR